MVVGSSCRTSHGPAQLALMLGVEASAWAHTGIRTEYGVLFDMGHGPMWLAAPVSCQAPSLLPSRTLSFSRF